MKNQRSFIGSPFSQLYDLKDQYQKKISQQQAKNSLFQISDQLFNDKSESITPETEYKKQTPSLSIQVSRKLNKSQFKKDPFALPKTQSASPQRFLPERLNQTLQFRRNNTSSSNVETSYRRKLLDIVEKFNNTEFQPKQCLNFNCYLVIDKRPPKVQKEIQRQKIKHYRSYSIRRSKSIQKSKQKKLLLLQNSLVYKTNANSKTKFNNKQKHFFGFEKTMRF